MALRYLDTNFFKSPFVRGLKGPLKTLYCFIICDCNGSGIWAADFEIASVYTGQKITKEEFEKGFAGKFVDLENGRYFFPDFIEHQYPKGLSATNPAHSNFVLELQKFNLLDESLKVLQRPSKGSKVMVTVNADVMVTVPVKVKDKEDEFDFEKFGLFSPLIEKWVQYKKSQHKESYKSQLTLEAFVKKLVEYSDGDFQIAEKIIDNSMSNLYKGIFPIEQKKQGNGLQNQPQKLSPREAGLAAMERLMNRTDLD